jgi:hypothetical protein
MREYRDMSRGLTLIPMLIKLLPIGLLGGCGEPIGTTVVSSLLAVSLGPIPVIQRTPFDAVWSIHTGQDCSVVRWDKGLSYCRPVELPPVPPPFCSRSLGGVDCWADPASLGNRPREMADGARSLTPAQEAHRTRTWPEF